MDLFNFFMAQARTDEIFDGKSYDPNLLASAWYDFSRFMPRFLVKLASLSRSEYVFSRLLSIANEEMGDGNDKLIHSEDFKYSCELNNILIDQSYQPNSLNVLRSTFKSEVGDPEILGIHLGLEIIANENINELLTGLGGGRLRNSSFFKIHLINESEHIRKCIDNYDFCDSQSDKDKFMEGFSRGIEFWQSFWTEVSLNG